VNPTPVSVAPAFGFERLKVNDVLPFSVIVAAPNALPIIGGAGFGESPLRPPQPLRLATVLPMASTTIANAKMRSFVIAAVTWGE